jgi:protein gp37
MSDLFHPDVPEDFIRAVFAIMAAATWHTFQILTKRPERMREILIRWDSEGLVLRSGYGMQLPNVWVGVSAEDQKAANERIPILLETPAAVRWVSIEPMIGPVTFLWAKWQSGFKETLEGLLVRDHLDGLRSLDWIVVGGESGPNARPMEAEWVRKIKYECEEAGTPLFVKQLGAAYSDPADGIAGASLKIPEEAIDLLKRRLKHRSGADMEAWPEDLKIRKWPEGNQCQNDQDLVKVDKIPER